MKKYVNELFWSFIIFLFRSLAIVTFGALWLTLMCVVAGWLIATFCGWLFGDTIIMVLEQLGIEGIKPWQVGVFLGFLASFTNLKVKFLMEEFNKQMKKK